MWSFDKAKLLAELRRDKEGRREAISTRQRRLDADRVRPSMPQIVHKTIDNSRVRDDNDAIDEPSAAIYDAPFDPEQTETICHLLAIFRDDLVGQIRNEISSEVAELRGRIEVLTTLIGRSDGVRSARSARTRRRP